MSKEWFASSGGAWPWVAFGGRSRFFGSGEVRLAILSLLDEGPKHGYQVMKELEERSGGLYRASAGSIYPTLQQLEDEDLIQSSQQNGKRVFSITEAGKAELAKDPEAVKRIWARAEEWERWGQYMNPDTVSVMKPLMALGKAAWSAAARNHSKPGGEEKVREVLDRARQELEQM
ncbi:MAG TPA: PadR family transcriptional regulator [Bryobacteraceae bacterium]|nr:PadR family transcriptional regulator [Bryobacteraceae bacterium]